MYPLPSVNNVATGEKIRQIMKEKNLTVSDVQDYLNLEAVQTIYHWFHGRNAPSLDNLYALSKYFGVSIDEILCGN